MENDQKKYHNPVEFFFKTKEGRTIIIPAFILFIIFLALINRNVDIEASHNQLPIAYELITTKNPGRGVEIIDPASGYELTIGPQKVAKAFEAIGVTESDMIGAIDQYMVFSVQQKEVVVLDLLNENSQVIWEGEIETRFIFNENIYIVFKTADGLDTISFSLGDNLFTQNLEEAIIPYTRGVGVVPLMNYEQNGTQYLLWNVTGVPGGYLTSVTDGKVTTVQEFPGTYLQYLNIFQDGESTIDSIIAHQNLHTNEIELLDQEIIFEVYDEERLVFYKDIKSVVQQFNFHLNNPSKLNTYKYYIFANSEFNGTNEFIRYDVRNDSYYTILEGLGEEVSIIDSDDQGAFLQVTDQDGKVRFLDVYTLQPVVPENNDSNSSEEEEIEPLLIPSTLAGGSLTIIPIESDEK